VWLSHEFFTILSNTFNSSDTSTASDTIAPDLLPSNTTAAEDDASPGLVFFTLSDKSFLALFSTALSNYSILTLYFTFVFAFGRFLRLYVLNMSQRIMYEDIPDCSFVLELCSDIFSARSDGEYELEEDMYAELIQLYRVPEQMYEKLLPPGPLPGVHHWPANGRLRSTKVKAE